MARLPRLLIPGQLHLLTQRSAGGLPVFENDADFALYLAPLRELLRAHEVSLHAYALLPSQVWLLLTPARSESLSRLMQAQGRRFGAAYNRAQGRSGVLWEGRFRATVVDSEAFGMACVQFVETAPTRTNLCQDAADYVWCSAGHHLGQRHDALITEHALHWSLGNTPFEREAAYKERYRKPQPELLRQKIETAAMKDWALASPEVLQQWNVLTPRRLTALPRGRPGGPTIDKTVPK